MDLISKVEGAVWPAVCVGASAQLLALQFQMAQSQWWSPSELREKQLLQLGHLVSHAAAKVPFYAARFRDAGLDPLAPLSADAWARLPPLSRKEVQSLGEDLRAKSWPESHGKATTTTTGGSSGIPVRIDKTALDGLFWTAAHLREELWHRQEPRSHQVRIRRVPPQLNPAQAARVRGPSGLTLPNWGAPMNDLWQTGPLTILDDRVPLTDQLALIERTKAAYLFTFPSNLRLLLSHCRKRSGSSPRTLRSVWTMSEVVDDELRASCKEVFGCKIVHNYSSAECGYMALQCPEREHFHVQSEVTMVEVLDEDGRQCEPGRIGKVVVTPLHNFATPLLRYEIGDEAEVGAPCSCGRGLPVLSRIVGRSYDYLVLSGGRRRRVDTGYYRICKVRAVCEFQLVQLELDLVELRMVLTRPLTSEETADIEGVLREEFGAEFRLRFTVCESLPRTAAGKLRSFVSELDG